MFLSLKYLAPSIFRGDTVWNYQQITQKPHLKLNLTEPQLIVFKSETCLEIADNE